MNKNIAFQGVFGAYSHLACKEIYPDATYLPCSSFNEAFKTVQNGFADLAIIPIENSNAGRVADVHFLLSQTPLHIIGEHFLRIKHQLLGLPNTTLSLIKRAISHPQALAQCSNYLQQHNIAAIPQTDTALSCEILLNSNDNSTAAIASSVAAEIYGLKVLAPDIENTNTNTTRFLVMSKKNQIQQDIGQKFITSLIFKAKNIPAALYKALGGFATNNLNITKLESYLTEGKFISAQFYLEVEAHPNQYSFQNALEELDFFSEELTILGTYTAHPYRYKS